MNYRLHLETSYFLTKVGKESLIVTSLPLLFRSCLELFFYQAPLGYDSMANYIPVTTGYMSNSMLYLWMMGPMYYWFLDGLYFSSGNIVLSVKLLNVLVQALFSFSIYIWLRERMEPRKSLLLTLSTILYFPILGFAWGLERNVMSLAFLFLTLSLVDRNSYLSSITGAATSLSDPLGFVLLAPILLSRFRSKYTQLALLFSTVMFSITFYLNAEVPTFTRGLFLPVQGFPAQLSSLLYFAYLMLPMTMFVLILGKDDIGRTKNSKIFLDMFVMLVASMFFLIVFPHYAGRFSLSAAIPASLIISKAIFESRRSSLIAGFVLMIVIFSIGYAALPPQHPLPYLGVENAFGNFNTIIPTSLEQSTIPLAASNTVLEILHHYVLAYSGPILLTDVFLGYAVIAHVPKSDIIYENSSVPNQIPRSVANQSKILYTIWWVNGKGWYNMRYLPTNFVPVYVMSGYALYEIQN
jgi:hypothetical protein